MSLLRLYNHQSLNPEDLPFKNFHELISNQSKNPAPFVNFYDQGQLKVKISFSDFVKLTENFSQLILESFNPSLHDKIVVVMENTPETLIVYSAVMSLGLVLVPVDPHQSADYYKKVSMQFNTVFLITNEGHPSEFAFTRTMNYSDKESRNVKNYEKRQANVMFTSSGTTGLPKGIVQSFNALQVNTLATIKVHNLDKSSKHFCILPLFHVNAFSFSFFTSLVNGNELILNRGFSQVNFWDTVNETKPVIVSAIPPVLRVLTEDPRDFTTPSSLKYFVSAASNLGKKTLLNFYKKFNVPVIQAYGLSETVNFTATFPTDLTKEKYEFIMAADEKTTIGPEVWGNNVFLMDENAELINEEKTEGELVVRGWNILKEYYQNEATTSEALAQDYFHTGDVGYYREFDGKRFYYLSGRKKEVAKVNGKLIFLNEVDEALMQADDFENICSVCYLDQNQEEQLGVFIILNRALDLSEIKTEIKKYLSKEIPVKKIFIGSEIKMTASGKKRRSEMARTYFNETESQ